MSGEKALARAQAAAEKARADSLAVALDAYATWDPDKATDLADGWPDTAMVPLVEGLRERGVVTLQSCAGHEGESDGCLWVAAATVTFPNALFWHPAFTSIRRTYTPFDQWEFWWLPGDVDAAVDALGALSVGERPHPGMSPFDNMMIDPVDRHQFDYDSPVDARLALAWEEGRSARPQYLGPDGGHYEGCGGWEDCHCGSYVNPYRITSLLLGGGAR